MAALHLAGIYTRRVGASVARIRENVLDWEHLPALHGSSFAACDLIDTDAEGWRVRIVNQGSDSPQVLKLFMAADTSGYRVMTEAGPGAESEIRVALTPFAPHETDIVVEYHVPEADPARLAMIGRSFVAIYTQLWDEDEAMMQAREAALNRHAKAPTWVDLGPEAALDLPLAFDFGAGQFWLVRHDGALRAHSATCPHWLGPLEGLDEQGCLTCPWHGYRFDAVTGHSADGRGLRLAPAPRISVEAGKVTACA